MAPNFMNHLVISFCKHDLHKKVRFQDICSVDPVENPPPKKAIIIRGKSDGKYLRAHGPTNKFQASRAGDGNGSRVS